MRNATTTFPGPHCCLWSILLFTSACTLNDYGYLGAKRETAALNENLGGMTAGAGSSGRGGRLIGEVGGSTEQNTAGSASTATNAGDGALGGNSVGAGGTAGTTQSGATHTASSAGTSAAGGMRGSSVGGFGSTGNSGGYGSSPSQGGSATVTDGGSSIGGGPAVTGGGSSTGGTAAATGGSAAGGTAAATGGSAAGGIAAATGGVVSYTGMARADVPFTTRGQLARYFMRFSPMVSVVESAVGGTLKIRVRAVQAGNTQYQMLIQQDSSPYSMCFSPVQTLPADITTSWVTLTWSLASCSANTSIGRLAFDLITSSAADAPTPSYTAILIDSIWIELNGKTISGPFNFDSQGTINGAALANDWSQALGVLYLRPSTVEPAATAPAGSTISWQASL